VMRKTMSVVGVAGLCTANTVTAVGAQTLDVVALGGKTVSVSFETLERRTIVTEDRGLRVEFQGVALRDVLVKAGIPFGETRRARWIRQVNRIEVRQLQ
jgi:hypothetical protein